MSAHKQTQLEIKKKSEEILNELPEFIRDYARSIHHSVAPRTILEYCKDIKTFFSYLEDVKHIREVSVETLGSIRKTDFEIYFEYLEHYEKDFVERTNARVSIKRKMSSLRSLYDYLFTNELIPSNELAKVLMPKLSKKEIIYLNEDEAKKLMDDTENGIDMTKKEKDYHKKQNVRDTAILALLLSTGIRVSECAELDIDDVDMKSSSVHIVRKGGDESIVYFSDNAAAYIESYLEERKNMEGVKDEKALFLSSRKQRMNVRTIEMLVKKHAKKSVPLKHITPHKLRSSYATNLYKATGDIYAVAESLGHKSVQTTRDHYAHISTEHRRENRNKTDLV